MTLSITYEQLFDVLRREKVRDELQKLEPNFYLAVRSFLQQKQAIIQQESVGLQSLMVQRASIEYQNVKKILRELFDRRERKILTLAMHKTRTESAIIEVEPLLPEERMFFESLVQMMLQTRGVVFGGDDTQTISYPSIAHVGIATQDANTTSVDEDEAKVTENTTGIFENSNEEQSSVERNTVQSDEDNKEEHTATAVEIVDGDTYSSVENPVMVRFLAPVPKFVGKDMRVFGPYETGISVQLPDDIAQILVRKGRAVVESE